jgi:HemY protein
MIKLIFTLILFLAIALFGVWVSNNNFPIVANLLDYQIETNAAKLSVATLIAALIMYSVIRLLTWVKNSPTRFAAKLQKDKEKQGYRDLMRGFSALAAGDMTYAKKLADRAESALETQPLVKLLQAQTAVLSNKPFEAEKYYLELTKTDESRILGYRGLIAQAIENHELPRALELSEDLHKLNPSATWVNEAMIDLAMRNQDWDKVEKYTFKARKSGILNRISADINLAIVHYFYALERFEKIDYAAAIKDLRLALKYNPKFLPAIILLAQALYEERELKVAAKHIEAAWKVRPHPQLANVYEQVITAMSPELSPEKKLKKFEKLLKINGDDIESIIAYASLAIKLNQESKAAEEIRRGLEIRETKKLCLLMADIEEYSKWQQRAISAESDKVWYCTQAGSEYANWQLYSNSGFFNTIIWGYNQQSMIISGNLQNPMDSFLLIK